MSLAPGQKLGPYQVVSPLGAGGMGEVYRARDTRLDRIVALKILPEEFSCDPVRKQRFEREAKTISSLNHPHICVLYDVGCQDGIDYLVMECVEGESLAKRLEKGPLPVDQVLKYGGQIASALDMAHRRGVIHRDLKPGNIMLTSTGAKLLDFGLAKPASLLASGDTLSAVALRSSPVTEEGSQIDDWNSAPVPDLRAASMPSISPSSRMSIRTKSGCDSITRSLTRWATSLCSTIYRARSAQTTDASMAGHQRATRNSR